MYLIVLSLLFSGCDSLNISNSDVIEVITGLNWTSGVRIVGPGQGHYGSLVAMTKLASKGHIFVMPANDDDDDSRINHQILPFVYSSTDNSSMKNFLEVLANGIYPTEGLLLLTEYSLTPDVKNVLKNCGYSRAFFHHRIGSSPDSIVRMQTFRHKEILLENTWRKDNESARYHPSYNFQGAKFTMLGTQNDYPYLYVIPNPFDPTLAYYSVGANIDSFDVLRAMFNFTLEVRISWTITGESSLFLER